MPTGIRITNAQQVAEQLSAAIRSLSRLSGLSERDVTRGVAGRVLKKWAGYAKVAAPGIIDRNARLRAIRGLDLTHANPISINVGIRGQQGLIWYRRKDGRFLLAGAMRAGGGFLQANSPDGKPRRWGAKNLIDLREAAVDAELAINREVQKGQRAAGLARQSVIQIADSIGIKLEMIGGTGISAAGIAKARRAIASDGQAHVNGTGSEQESAAGKYFVSLVNTYPWQAKAQLDSGLLRAISGEEGYFRQNMQKGVFDSLANTARAYPWMKLQAA